MLKLEKSMIKTLIIIFWGGYVPWFEDGSFYIHMYVNGSFCIHIHMNIDICTYIYMYIPCFMNPVVPFMLESPQMCTTS
jgi:hypothetical protein